MAAADSEQWQRLKDAVLRRSSSEGGDTPSKVGSTAVSRATVAFNQLDEGLYRMFLNLVTGPAPRPGRQGNPGPARPTSDRRYPDRMWVEQDLTPQCTYCL